MADRQPRRIRLWIPRFSLRFFLVVMIVGTVGTWLVHSQMQRARCQRELQAAVSGEGTVRFHWEVMDEASRSHPDQGLVKVVREGRAPGPKSFRVSRRGPHQHGQTLAARRFKTCFASDVSFREPTIRVCGSPFMEQTFLSTLKSLARGVVRCG